MSGRIINLRISRIDFIKFLNQLLNAKSRLNNKKILNLSLRLKN